jgi:hypothetical protein
MKRRGQNTPSLFSFQSPWKNKNDEIPPDSNGLTIDVPNTINNGRPANNNRNSAAKSACFMAGRTKR